jgi:UDP-sugar transporter A1/2/3
VVSVGIDLGIKLQSQSSATSGGYSFSPISAVILTEVMKFALSAVLLVAGGDLSWPEKFTWSDAKWLIFPACLYMINNLLVFKALGANDAASFGIFRDTAIIWTAAIRWSVFGTPLGSVRLGGIALILIGLFVNRASSIMANKGSISLVFLWVILMTLTNATASVANEYALKRNKELNINFQNMVLYFAGISFLSMMALSVEPALILSPRMFFKGFTPSAIMLVLIQGCQGLLVSRLLKYADAMTKTVATCLRGPTLVVVAAMFVTNSGSSVFTIGCAGIVATGCFVFLSQGPLK